MLLLLLRMKITPERMGMVMVGVYKKRPHKFAWFSEATSW